MATINVFRPRVFNVGIQPSNVYAYSPYRPHASVFSFGQMQYQNMLNEQIARAIISPFQLNDPNVIKAIRKTHGITDDGSYEMGQNIGGTIGLGVGIGVAAAKYAPIIMGGKSAVTASGATTAALATAGGSASIPVAGWVVSGAALLTAAALIVSSYQMGKVAGSALSKEGRKGLGRYLQNIGGSMAQRPVTAVLNLAGTFVIPAVSRAIPIPVISTIGSMFAFRAINELGKTIDAGIFGKLDDKDLASYTDLRALRGDLVDSFTGNNIIKGVLASAPKGFEDFDKMIARSYGDHEEGYSPLGFNQVREAYGVDIGTFGNGIIDMIGESTISTTRLMGAVSTPIKDSLSKHTTNFFIGRLLNNPDSLLGKYFLEKVETIVDDGKKYETIKTKDIKLGGFGLKQLHYRVHNLITNYRPETNKENINFNKGLIDQEATIFKTTLLKQHQLDRLNIEKDKREAYDENKIKEINELSVEYKKMLKQSVKEVTDPYNINQKELREIDFVLSKLLDTKQKQKEFNVDLTLFKEMKNGGFLLDSNALNKYFKTNASFNQYMLANQSIGSVIDWISSPTQKLLSNRHVRIAMKKALTKISESLNPIKINEEVGKLLKQEDVNLQKELKEIDESMESYRDTFNRKRNERKINFVNEKILEKYGKSLEEKINELNETLSQSNLTEKEINKAKSLKESIEQEVNKLHEEFEESNPMAMFEKSLEKRKEELRNLAKVLSEYRKKGLSNQKYVKGSGFFIRSKEELKQKEERLESLLKEKENKSLSEEDTLNLLMEQSELESQIDFYKNNEIIERVYKDYIEQINQVSVVINLIEYNIEQGRIELEKLFKLHNIVVLDDDFSLLNLTPVSEQASQAKVKSDSKKLKELGSRVGISPDNLVAKEDELTVASLVAYFGEDIAREIAEDLARGEFLIDVNFATAVVSAMTHDFDSPLRKIFPNNPQLFQKISDLFKEGTQAEELIKKINVRAGRRKGEINFLNKNDSSVNQLADIIKERVLEILDSDEVKEVTEERLINEAKEYLESKNNVKAIIKSMVYAYQSNVRRTGKLDAPMKRSVKVGNLNRANFNLYLTQKVMKSKKGISELTSKLEHLMNGLVNSIESTLEVFEGAPNEKRLFNQLKNSLKNITYSEFLYSINQKYSSFGFFNRLLGEKKFEKIEGDLSFLTDEDLKFLSEPNLTMANLRSRREELKKRHGNSPIMNQRIDQLFDEVEVLSGLHVEDEVEMDEDEIESFEKEVQDVAAFTTTVDEEDNVNVYEKIKEEKYGDRELTETEKYETKREAIRAINKELDKRDQENQLNTIKNLAKETLEKRQNIRKEKINKIDSVIKTLSKTKDKKQIKEYENLKKYYEDEKETALSKAYRKNKLLDLVDIEDLHKIILGRAKVPSYKISQKDMTEVSKQKLDLILKNENLTLEEKILNIKKIFYRTFVNRNGIIVPFNRASQLDDSFWSQYPDVYAAMRQEMKGESKSEVLLSFLKGQDVRAQVIDEAEYYPEYIENIYDSSFKTLQEINENDLREWESVEITKESKVGKLTKDVSDILKGKTDLVSKVTVLKNKENHSFEKEIELKGKFVKVKFNILKIEMKTGNSFNLYVPETVDGNYISINGNLYAKQVILGEDQEALNYLDLFSDEIKGSDLSLSVGDTEGNGVSFNMAQTRFQESLMKVFFSKRLISEEDYEDEEASDFIYVGKDGVEGNRTKTSDLMKRHQVYIPKNMRGKANLRNKLKEAGVDTVFGNATGNNVFTKINLSDGKTYSIAEVLIPALYQLNDTNYSRMMLALNNAKQSKVIDQGQKPKMVSSLMRNEEDRNKYIHPDGINLRVAVMDYYSEENGLSTIDEKSIIKRNAAERIFGKRPSIEDYDFNKDEETQRYQQDLNEYETKLSYFKLIDRYSNKSTLTVVEDKVYDSIVGGTEHEGTEIIVSKTSLIERGSQAAFIEMAMNELSTEEDHIYYDDSVDVETNYHRMVTGNQKAIPSEEERKAIINKLQNTIGGEQFFYLTDDMINEETGELLKPKVAGRKPHENSSSISYEVVSVLSGLQTLKINGEIVDPKGKLLDFFEKRSLKREDYSLDENTRIYGRGGTIKNRAMKLIQPHSYDDKLTSDPTLKDNEISITEEHAVGIGLGHYEKDTGQFKINEKVNKQALFIRYPSKGRGSLVFVNIVIRKGGTYDRNKIGIPQSYAPITNSDFDGDRGTLFSLIGADKETLSIAEKAFSHDYSGEYGNHSDNNYKVIEDSQDAKTFNKYVEEKEKKYNVSVTKTLKEKQTREEYFKNKYFVDPEKKIDFNFVPKGEGKYDDGPLRSQKVKEYAAKNQHLVDWLSSIQLTNRSFDYWVNEHFLKNPKQNILGVTDPMAIYNLARELLGQDAFDFAKRGSKDASLLDEMYEIIGPFESGNQDPRVMMIQLQKVLFAMGVWKQEQETVEDKEASTQKFRDKLKVIKSEAENVKKEIKKEINLLENFEADFNKEYFEGSLVKENKELEEQLNKQSEEIIKKDLEDIGVRTEGEKEPKDPSSPFVADFSKLSIDGQSKSLYELIAELPVSEESIEQTEVAGIGETVDYHDIYIRRISNVLRNVIGELQYSGINNPNIMSILITVKDKNGNERVERHEFKDLIDPNKTMGVYANKHIFSNTEDRSIVKMQFVSNVPDRLTSEFLNRHNYELFTSVADTISQKSHTEGHDRTVGVSPNMFNYMHDIQGYLPDFYKDLISENKDHKFNTVMGFIINKLNNEKLKETFLKDLKPFIITNEFVKFLGTEDSKSLLQQYLFQVIKIPNIFIKDNSSKGERYDLSIGDDEMIDGRANSVVMEEMIKNILEENGITNYEMYKQMVYNIGYKLSNLTSSGLLNSKHLRDLNDDAKANLIAKIAVIQIKGTETFKDLGLSEEDLLVMGDRNIGEDFVMDFFYSYQELVKKLYSSNLSNEEKRNLGKRLSIEHKKMSHVSRQISYFNKLSSLSIYTSNHNVVGALSYDPSAQVAFNIRKSSQQRTVDKENQIYNQRMLLYSKGADETPFSDFVKEEYSGSKRVNINTLDFNLKQKPKDQVEYLNKKRGIVSGKILDVAIKLNEISNEFGVNKSTGMRRMLSLWNNMRDNSSIRYINEDGDIKVTQNEMFHFYAKGKILEMISSDDPTIKSQGLRLQNQVESFGVMLESQGYNIGSITGRYAAYSMIGNILFDDEVYETEPQDRKGTVETYEEKRDSIIKEIVELEEFHNKHMKDNTREITTSILESEEYQEEIKKHFPNVSEEKLKKINQKVKAYKSMTLIDKKTKTFDTYRWGHKQSGHNKYTLTNLFLQEIYNNDNLNDSYGIFKQIRELIKQDEMFRDGKGEVANQGEYNKLVKKYIGNLIKKENPKFYSSLKNKGLHTAIIDARLNVELFKLISERYENMSAEELGALFNERPGMKEAVLSYRNIEDRKNLIFLDTENLINDSKNIYEISYITFDEKGNPIYKQKFLPSNPTEQDFELWRNTFNMSEKEIDNLKKTLAGGSWDSSIKAFKELFEDMQGKILVGQAIDSSSGNPGDIERLNDAYERLITSKVRNEVRDLLVRNEYEEQIKNVSDGKELTDLLGEAIEKLGTPQKVQALLRLTQELTKDKMMSFIYGEGFGDRTQIEKELYLREMQRLQFPFLNYNKSKNPRAYLKNELTNKFNLSDEQAAMIVETFFSEFKRLENVGYMYYDTYKLKRNESGFFEIETKELIADEELREYFRIEFDENNYVSMNFFRQAAFDKILPTLIKLAVSQNENLTVEQALKYNSFQSEFYKIAFENNTNIEHSDKVKAFIEEANTHEKGSVSYFKAMKLAEREYKKENEVNIFEGEDVLFDMSDFSYDTNELKEALGRVSKLSKSISNYQFKKQLVEKIKSVSNENKQEYLKDKDDPYKISVDIKLSRLKVHGDLENLSLEDFTKILDIDVDLISLPIVEEVLENLKARYIALKENGIPDRFAFLESRESPNLKYEKDLVDVFIEMAFWDSVSNDLQFSSILGNQIEDFKTSNYIPNQEVQEINELANNKKIENEKNKKVFRDKRNEVKNFILNKNEKKLKAYFLNSPKYKNEQEAINAYESFISIVNERFEELKLNGFNPKTKKFTFEDGKIQEFSEGDTKIQYVQTPAMERLFFKRAIELSWQEINEILYVDEIVKSIDPSKSTKDKVTFEEYNKNITKYDGHWESSDFDIENELDRSVGSIYRDIYKKVNQYNNLSKYQIGFFETIAAYKDPITGEYDKKALLKQMTSGYLAKNFKVTYITTLAGKEKEAYDKKIQHQRDANLETFRTQASSELQNEYEAISGDLSPLIDKIDNTAIPTMKVITVSNMNDLEQLLLLAERGEVGFTTNYDMIQAKNLMNYSPRLNPVLNFVHRTVNYFQKAMMLMNPMFIINIATSAIRKNYEGFLVDNQLRNGNQRMIYEFAKAQKMDGIYNKHSNITKEYLLELNVLAKEINEGNFTVEKAIELNEIIKNQVASIELYLENSDGLEDSVAEKLGSIKKEFEIFSNSLDNYDERDLPRLKHDFENYVRHYIRSDFISKIVINGFNSKSGLDFTNKEGTKDEIEMAKMVNDIYKSKIIFDPYELESRNVSRDIQKELSDSLYHSFRGSTMVNGIQKIIRGTTQPFRYMTDYINRVSRIHSVLIDQGLGKTNIEAYNNTVRKFFNYGQKGLLEKEATVFFPFMSYAIRNLDYYLDMMNNPRYMDLISDLAQGARTWYNEPDDSPYESNFFTNFIKQRGWIPLGKNYGIKLTDQMLNAYNFVNQPEQFITNRMNPILTQAAKATKGDNFDTLRAFGLNSSFYGGAATAINNLAGNKIETPADLFPSIFYKDEYTKFTPYKYRSKFGDYRNLRKELFFPDGNRRTPSRNAHTIAKQILYKNYVNARLMNRNKKF